MKAAPMIPICDTQYAFGRARRGSVIWPKLQFTALFPARGECRRLADFAPCGEPPMPGYVVLTEFPSGPIVVLFRIRRLLHVDGRQRLAGCHSCCLAVSGLWIGARVKEHSAGESPRMQGNLGEVEQRMWQATYSLSVPWRKPIVYAHCDRLQTSS
jgi:hypothetical protein